jgi:hypothetical protein
LGVKESFEMVWTSDEVAHDEPRSIAEHLRPNIEPNLRNLGFITDDGIRFFRRNGHLIHFFKLVVQHLGKGAHGARTDGNHLWFYFGEALDFTPGLLIRSGKMTCATVVEENTDVYSIAKQTHYLKACEKICSAATEIDKARWAQVQTEDDYLDFHLRCSPSLEKIYLLTVQSRHNEADAWLRLLLHKDRAIRAFKGEGSGIEIYRDIPEEPVVVFSSLSGSDRVCVVEEKIKSNILLNEIGFLYEAV